MEYCIKQIKRYFPTEKIKISAQAHLEKFYNKHAFMATGEAYLEDGIPHIGMILKS
jgi:ElaA protein